MAAENGAAGLEVQVGCICPDNGHGDAGDTITLRPVLDYAAVRAIRYAGAIVREDDPDSSIATLMAVMNEGFILHGVESWTVRDKGKPVEVTPQAIRSLILARTEDALVIGDFADSLYQPQVLLPLLALAGRSSRRSQTTGSTSPRSESPSTSPSPATTDPSDSSGESSIPSAKPPRRSRRSSTTSTPMDSTGATS